MTDLVPKAQATKAVTALLAHLSKTQESADTLFQEEEKLTLVIAFQKIPNKTSKLPHRLELPHGLYETESAQICLITKDPQEHFEELIEGLDLPGKVEVISITKLRKEYKEYEQRRVLCDEYDLFLTDERIAPLLPRLLGKSFYLKKKIPANVNVKTPTKAQKSITKMIRSTGFQFGQGPCSAIHFGHNGLKASELVANLLAVLEQAVTLVPGKGKSVLSLHVKSKDSIALPIYSSLPDAERNYDDGEEKKKRKAPEIRVNTHRAKKEKKEKKTTEPKQKKGQKAAKDTKAPTKSAVVKGATKGAAKGATKGLKRKKTTAAATATATPKPGPAKEKNNKKKRKSAGPAAAATAATKSPTPKKRKTRSATKRK